MEKLIRGFKLIKCALTGHEWKDYRAEEQCKCCGGLYKDHATWDDEVMRFVKEERRAAIKRSEERNGHY